MIYETYPESFSPAPTFAGELELALSLDGICPGILSALFAKAPRETLAYVRSNPRGRNQRRVWYLFELLTGRKLPLKSLAKGAYVDILEKDLYYTSDPVRITRQRVNDNLLGDARFCPIVRRTRKLAKLEKSVKPFDFFKDYPGGVLKRAFSYLKNSRHRELEGLFLDDASLSVLGDDHDFVNKKDLVTLQNRIAVPQRRDKGYRISQSYLMKTDKTGAKKVRSVPARPEDLEGLMEGLYASHSRLEKTNPVVHAAVISFGLVFIHPFCDGNGRLHRFVAQNILSRRGVAPRGLVFPMFAISPTEADLPYYSAIDSYNDKLMRLVKYEGRGGDLVRVQGATADYYRYIDMTDQAELLYESIDGAARTNLMNELRTLCGDDSFGKALHSLENIPDRVFDKVVSLCMDGKKGSLGRAVHQAVRKALPPRAARTPLYSRPARDLLGNPDEAFESAWRILGVMSSSLGADGPLPMRPNLPDAFMKREVGRLVKNAAFSLIELLVALSILAVVAAIIVPRFTNIRSQVAATVAAAQFSQINESYNSWTSLGGNPNGDSGINILRFLGTPGNGTPNRGLSGVACSDITGGVGSSTISLNGMNVYPPPQQAGVGQPDGFYGLDESGNSGVYYQASSTLYTLAYSPSGSPAFSPDAGRALQAIQQSGGGGDRGYTPPSLPPGWQPSPATIGGATVLQQVGPHTDIVKTARGGSTVENF